jgi:hypothetical protein
MVAEAEVAKALIETEFGLKQFCLKEIAEAQPRVLLMSITLE